MWHHYAGTTPRRQWCAIAFRPTPKLSIGWHEDRRSSHVRHPVSHRRYRCSSGSGYRRSAPSRSTAGGRHWTPAMNGDTGDRTSDRRYCDTGHPTNYDTGNGIPEHGYRMIKATSEIARTRSSGGWNCSTAGRRSASRHCGASWRSRARKRTMCHRRNAARCRRRRRPRRRTSAGTWRGGWCRRGSNRST